MCRLQPRLRRLQPYSTCYQVREQRQAERGRQREAMHFRQEQARGKQQQEQQVRGVLNRVLTQVERGAERDAKGAAREVSALLGVMLRQVPWRAGLHSAPYSTSYDAFGGGRAAPACGHVCIMGAVPRGLRGGTQPWACTTQAVTICVWRGRWRVMSRTACRWARP